MKSPIQNKKNGGIVRLLKPTLNKIIWNQGTYFVVIMNNRPKIITVHGAPLQSREGFFPPPKKFSHEGPKTFLGKKIMGTLF